MGLLVPGGFAWLFVSLFVADGCSQCCDGFTWLMVVHGGFFLVSWLGFFDRC